MKKSYEKPAVAKVKLASNEAVLNNCKVTPLVIAEDQIVCQETLRLQTFGS